MLPQFRPSCDALHPTTLSCIQAHWMTHNSINPSQNIPTMKTTMMHLPLVVLVAFASALSVSGFAPLELSRQETSVPSIISSSAANSRLFAGGFGGKSSGDKKKKSGSNSSDKESKLKPKQQWDRYSAFKKEPKIRVGVRCTEDESDEWLEVGRVRSKDNQYTELAVARQRAIIAEVRLCVKCSGVKL